MSAQCYINECDDVEYIEDHFERAYVQVDLLEEEIDKLQLKLDSPTILPNIKESYSMRMLILKGVKSRFQCYVTLCADRMEKLQENNNRYFETIYF